MGDVSRPAGYLEVWKPGGVEIVLLTGDRVTIGRTPGNGVVLDHDSSVSSLHAVLQSYDAGWTLRDLGSTNGTVVARERLLSEKALRPGDEIRVGQTRLTFRATSPTDLSRTTAPKRAPELTRRERDVLVALCRPLFSDDMFREAASLRDIAAALFVSEAAVKQHLLRLYDKFDVEANSGRRRTELANEAFRRGSVTPADLAAG